MCKIAVFLLVVLTGCLGKDLTPNKAVTGFDIDRYLGTWYEIARLDHSFERGCDQVSAFYSKRDDGGIAVVNSCVLQNGKGKLANGIAYFKGKEDVADLKVSFFRPFYGNYKVIFIDDAYQYALIDGGNYDYFWILSRKKQIDVGTLQTLIKKSKKFGFNVDSLIFPKQN